jgi:CelD/BcsL family acetyltransferase involved in cellulose biosynthesis
VLGSRFFKGRVRGAEYQEVREAAVLQGEVVSELGRLESFVGGWDALAVECRHPRSAAALVLAWYRNVLTTGAAIRAVVVTDGATVVGVAPFYVVRSGFGFYRYEMAAPLLHGVEPLYSPGRHDEVGKAFAVALASSDPAPDIVSLDWLPAGSPLPSALSTGCAGRGPRIVEGHSFPVPQVHMAGHDFESWLAARSKNFRKSFRSDHRKLVAEGFEFRVSTDALAIAKRLPDLQRLYERRRAARGGLGPLFDRAFMAMVSDAADTVAGGRMRLATMERSGEVIAADLLLGAGGETSAWFGGFDEAWAHLSPGRANVVLSIQDAMQRGDDVFDLGPGAEPYKYWFTDDEVTLQGCILLRRGLRPFHTPAQLLPFAARRPAARLVGRLRRSALAARGLAQGTRFGLANRQGSPI